MNREEIIMLVSDKLRLIRAEAGYTQDKMAEIIGVSKKTLVQIEKGRVLAGWSTVVTVCAHPIILLFYNLFTYKK